MLKNLQKKINFPGICQKRGSFSITRKNNVITSAYKTNMPGNKSNKSQFYLVLNRNTNQTIYGFFDENLSSD